jgi:hypothetical protein
MIEELLVLQTYLRKLEQEGKSKEALEISRIINNMENGTPKGTSHGTD